MGGREARGQGASRGVEAEQGDTGAELAGAVSDTRVMLRNLDPGCTREAVVAAFARCVGPAWRALGVQAARPGHGPQGRRVCAGWWLVCARRPQITAHLGMRRPRDLPAPPEASSAGRAGPVPSRRCPRHILPSLPSAGLGTSCRPSSTPIAGLRTSSLRGRRARQQRCGRCTSSW